MAECFPEKSRWCKNEQVCQVVKHFEQSHGLDTALYKSVPFSKRMFLALGVLIPCGHCKCHRLYYIHKHTLPEVKGTYDAKIFPVEEFTEPFRAVALDDSLTSRQTRKVIEVLQCTYTTQPSTKAYLYNVHIQHNL